MMEQNSREIMILSTIKEMGMPVGAIQLSRELEIPQGSMGRLLSQLEASGFVAKVSNKGRQITPRGLAYLDDYRQRSSRLESAKTLIDLSDSLSKNRLIEILEIRKLLECHAIQSTCAHITPQQVDAVEQLLLDNLYAITKGGSGNLEDLSLHLAIAQYSGNETAYQLLKLILTQNDAYIRFTSSADPSEQYHIEEHRRIVSAIKRRDHREARAAMEDHLNKVILDVQRTYT